MTVGPVISVLTISSTLTVATRVTAEFLNGDDECRDAWSHPRRQCACRLRDCQIPKISPQSRVGPPFGVSRRSDTCHNPDAIADDNVCQLETGWLQMESENVHKVQN